MALEKQSTKEDIWTCGGSDIVQNRIPQSTVQILEPKKSRVQEHFDLIVLATQDEKDQNKRMRQILMSIQSDAFLQEVLMKHSEHWKRVSSELRWWFPELVLPLTEDVTTYTVSSDRQWIREGFDFDYFRLLTCIAELHRWLQDEKLPPGYVAPWLFTGFKK